ncbi:MAG: RAMP superfamily CRISPR-associated protein [Bacteroidales bacterium]|nr:RAMP superfamily CRISPR-associated protein [Bacteroidales bacterium]
MRLRYTIEFFNEWHCGSGLASGADVDALVVKDKDNLPFVPGKTLKGLVREAAEDIIQFGKVKADIVGLFGNSKYKNNIDNLDANDNDIDNEKFIKEGALFFSNAEIIPDEKKAIISNGVANSLYKSLSSTAIDDNGVAKKSSLRKIEVVVPCKLEGYIDNVPAEAKSILENCMSYIKRLGQSRNRGLGRCKFSDFREEIEEKSSLTQETEKVAKLQYKCTLETDVVISQSARTEGHQQSLDYISGNVFLGIVAKGGNYDSFKEKALDVFHSNKVRFSDAHLAINGCRSVKIPNVMFYQKGKDIKDDDYKCYIRYFLSKDEENKLVEADKNFQLKQCRNGFYSLVDGKFVTKDICKSFAIKSANDKNKRRSADEKMYGYQSICKGAEFLFEINFNGVDADLINKIDGYIQGIHHIGRSKTAQYGCVKIEKANYADIPTLDQAFEIDGEKYVSIYADSRLIFIDENTGLQKYQPSEKDLNLPDGAKIDWTKTQIRTFDYAPWNFKRQTREADRTGIEKGSVFVVNVTKCNCKVPYQTSFVGYYQNEGFGKVICNPEFLAVEDKYFAKYTPQKEDEEKAEQTKAMLEGTALLEYLNNRKTSKLDDVYKAVENFINSDGKKFEGKEKFASQWGAIRGIATATNKASDIKKNILAFIGHGVKSSDWTDGAKPTRYDVLEEFMNDNAVNIRQSVIHLATEMGKQCKKEDK